MTAKLFLEYSMFAEIAVGVAILTVMLQKHLLARFWALSSLVLVLTTTNSISLAMLYFRKQLGFSKEFAYDIYSASNWIALCFEYALIILVIYGVFSQAMKPLEGLHRAGKVVFRWVFGVSAVLSMGIALGPHLGGGAYLIRISGQLQQVTDVLTLCLLMFVCLATRYLGLTYRSHIFGVSLGLGIYTAVSLVETAWYSSIGTHSLYSPVFAFSAIGTLASLLTWGTYFAMPEPERKMVLLPTTSPYFLWNSISEALGDEPGFVAIAGFKPEMLAPAEMTMLKAASKRVQASEAVEAAKVPDTYGASDVYGLRRPPMSERPAMQSIAVQ